MAVQECSSETQFPGFGQARPLVLSDRVGAENGFTTYAGSHCLQGKLLMQASCQPRPIVNPPLCPSPRSQMSRSLLARSPSRCLIPPPMEPGPSKYRLLAPFPVLWTTLMLLAHQPPGHTSPIPPWPGPSRSLVTPPAARPGPHRARIRFPWSAPRSRLRSSCCPAVLPCPVMPRLLPPLTWPDILPNNASRR